MCEHFLAERDGVVEARILTLEFPYILLLIELG